MNERDRIAGKTGGHCYYCGCELPDRWHVDHKFPKRKAHWVGSDIMMDETCAPNDLEDIESIENKVPSCPRCNIRKGALDVEQFREEISLQIDRLKRDSGQFRLALDYGLIEVTDNEVQFYFEQPNELSEECVSCVEELEKNRCRKSKRDCGHHCNHSWTQDECCWCGEEF